VSVRILIKQTDMPSCVFIKTCWSLSKAYCIPGKLCHFQSSGIFWHYEKTNVIFELGAPKISKKHQKIKIKNTTPKVRCPDNECQPVHESAAHWGYERLFYNSHRFITLLLYVQRRFKGQSNFAPEAVTIFIKRLGDGEWLCHAICDEKVSPIWIFLGRFRPI